MNTDSDEHRQLFRAYFAEDDAVHAAISEEQWEGMFRAQCTWDAAMGWNAQIALELHGGEDAIMVVLIGAGHVTYGLGAERQIAQAFGRPDQLRWCRCRYATTTTNRSTRCELPTPTSSGACRPKPHRRIPAWASR